MSSSKVNTWSIKCQSSNGLKVTLVKKRKSSPEQNDVGGGLEQTDVGCESAEELKPNQTVGLGGPRWTIESKKNPCRLVIKRRKTNDYPDSSKDTCSSGEPSLKMRIVASKKTSQDSETTFLRVKNWCKQQISNSASVVLCDNYLASDLQFSQPSPKCSGLESCLSAELFHLQPSPKDSGIDVSSPPRRLDEIHLPDVSSCVAMATISDGAITTLSSATSMVVSDVVMATFSNAKSANQDGVLHAVKHGVGNSALKTGEARACGEVGNRLGGRTTRRLSNLQSLCAHASPKASSAPEEDRIMLRLPSSMFRAAVGGNAGTKDSPAAGVRSRKRNGSVSFTETDSSKPGALDIVKKTRNGYQMGEIFTSVTDSKDPIGPTITGVTRSSTVTGPVFVREGKSKTKTSLVLGEEMNSHDPDITGQVKSMGQTDQVDTTVMVTKSSRFKKEKRSKFQTGPSFTGSNRITAKIYPDISIENRSKGQTDPSITKKDKSKAQTNASIIETDKSKGQTDPSITKKDKSKAQTNASIIETDNSKDQTDPSITEMDGNKDQADPSITERDRSKDQTVPSITEMDGNKDQADPSITERDRSKDQTDPSITEMDRIMEQTAHSITSKSRSKDQTDPSITKKDKSKARTSASIIETDNSKDQSDPSITEKDRIMEQTACGITSKSRSKDQIAPSITRRERSKAHVGTSKMRRQKHVSPTDIAATSIKDPVELSLTEEKISRNQTSSTVSGDTKTKSRSCPVSEETNSKDSAVSDETQSKNEFSQRIVTTVMMNKNDPAGARISGEARRKSQTGPKADMEIGNKNQSAPVVVEGTRKRNVNGSARKREMKSRNQICPSAAKEVSIKDTAGSADIKKMKSTNETSPVDTLEMDLKVHASSGCSTMRNNGEFNLGSTLALNTVNQTNEGIGSQVEMTEIQGGDEIAKFLKRKSSTEACELIPERQLKRSNSALQARKWHAGSRNSASRRSYGRLCHAAELPPPLLTVACSDPLRTMENSIESGHTDTFPTRPHLLRERRQSGSTAAYTKGEHAKTVAKPLAVDNGLTERDQQLSSLYDFEDDSPPVLDFINTSVNGRSIFPHRSRLSWKEKSFGSSIRPSGPVNTSTDQHTSKSVNLMPKLVQSSLTKAVDLPIVEANVSKSKSDLRIKTLKKSTVSYMGESASYVSSHQSNSNEAEAHAPILSASNSVQEAQIDKLERSNVKVKRNKSLPVSGASSVANESCWSKYSRKKVEKPGSGSAMSKKCKNLSKPTVCELQTTSQFSFASEVQDICQAVTQDDESGLSTSKEKLVENDESGLSTSKEKHVENDESGLSTSKEKHLESEGPISDDASAVDCSLCTDTLRAVTYHRPISENMSETLENSVKPEEFDFSLFISEQKSLERLQDKVTRLLRTVCPGIVGLYDKPNIPVVCKLLDQLLDEMACSKAEGETRTETCCCDCEVSLCRTPTECLRVFQRKVLGLLRILLPSADLENVDAIEVELLVDAVTLANATQLGEELCPSEKCSNSEPCCLGNSHIHETVNASSEEHCFCCCQDGQKDLCCHGGEHSHDNLNFGGSLQCSAKLASTCSEDSLLKSEESCINR